MTGLKILIGVIVLLVICGFVGYLWGVLFRKNIVSEVTELKLSYIGIALFIAVVAGSIEVWLNYAGEQVSNSRIDYDTVGFALLFMLIGWVTRVIYQEEKVKAEDELIKRLQNHNSKIENND